MPELPEVETMRRGILRAVGGRIRDISQLPCSCRPILIEPDIKTLRRRAIGKTVQSIDRLGKRVVVRLDSGDAFVFEPRMTGLLLVADPPDQDHLRIRLDVDQSPLRHIWYWDRRGLGSVRLLSSDDLAHRLGSKSLGPDALSLDSDQFRQRLGNSRREIKVALLDQKAIAGIGNLYASEILHVAGVHPQRRCDQLRPAEWIRLHAATGDVLHQAILHEGSTLSDGTYRNALNQQGGYQKHHRVYGRAGSLCSTCGLGMVERFVQAQRATFYCRTCQRVARQRHEKSAQGNRKS